MNILVLITYVSIVSVWSTSIQNASFVEPNIFLLGVKRGATTSLHKLLQENIGICSSGSKEKEIFNYLLDTGVEYYKSLFGSCKDGQLKLDSTSMFHNPEIPSRLISLYSAADLALKKFIVVLREPVSLEISLYEHHIRKCAHFLEELDNSTGGLNLKTAETPCLNVIDSWVVSNTSQYFFRPVPFRAYLAGSSINITSQYNDHLNNWIQYVNRSQIFLLNMDTLVQNTSDTMTRLQMFLGLTNGWGTDVVLPHEKDSELLQKSDSVDCRIRLETSLLYTHENEKLYEFVRNGPTRPPSEPYFPEFPKPICNFSSASVFRNTTKLRSEKSFVGTKHLSHHEKFQSNEDIVATASHGKYLTKPDFMIIGVQKGGTTSLDDLMKANSQICSMGAKEKHFFDFDWDKGLSYYERMFSMCPKTKYTIDSSPSYIRIEDVPKNIARSYTPEKLADLKFIVTLREPVARAFSWYEHRIRECSHGLNTQITEATKRHCLAVSGREINGNTKHVDPLNFRQYMKGSKFKISDGHYKDQLLNWMKYVKREQIFIINMQTLILNTTDTMHRIKRFLGLDIGWGDVTLPHDNKSQQVHAQLDCDTARELAEHYRKQNAGLLDLIRSSGSGNVSRPKMEPHFPPFEGIMNKCTK